MEFSFEDETGTESKGVVLDGLDRRLLEECLGILEQLPITGNVKLVLTADFDNSVRLRAFGNDELHRYFTYLRPSGSRVVAKAISPRGRRTSYIVVPAGMFLGSLSAQRDRRAAEIDVPRIIAHEGWHVVLQRKREDVSTSIDTVRRGASAWREALAYGLAAHLVEEFRVERTLCEQGLFRNRRATREDATGLLDAFSVIASAPALPRRYSRDGFLDTFWGLSQEQAYRLALLAAAQVVRKRPIPESIQASLMWTWGGGRERWMALVERLRQIPPADVRMKPRRLRDAVISVQSELSRWLQLLDQSFARSANQLVRAGMADLHGLLRTPIVVESTVRPRERPGHEGSHSRTIDALMDTAMEGKLALLNPRAIYVSEETQRTIDPAPGTIIFTCDQIDGTTNAVTIGTGFSVVGYFSRVRDDSTSMAHLGGAICNADGTTTTWSHPDRPGPVLISYPPFVTDGIIPQLLRQRGTIYRGELISLGSEPQVVSLVRREKRGFAAAARKGDRYKLACVAASPERRQLLRSYFELDADEVWYCNLGGNPLLPALLRGELGGIIEPEPVSLWDAVYLVPLQMVGGTVRTLDGGPVDVLSSFEELWDSKRKIGPFVATIDRRTADWICSLFKKRQPRERK